MKVLMRKHEPTPYVRISAESLSQLAVIMKRIVLCSTVVDDKRLSIAVGNTDLIIKPAAVMSLLFQVREVAKHIIVIDPLPSTCINELLVSIPHPIENDNIRIPPFQVHKVYASS